MLTDEQIAHSGTFGFVILRQVFDGNEVVITKREVDELLAENRGWSIGRCRYSVCSTFL